MKYAVGVINFFDNELTIEIINAENWKEALAKHSSMRNENENIGDVTWLSDDISDAKFEAYNADFMFDVKEIVG